jgi:hypothetical protein
VSPKQIYKLQRNYSFQKKPFSMENKIIQMASQSKIDQEPQGATELFNKDLNNILDKHGLGKKEDNEENQETEEKAVKGRQTAGRGRGRGRKKDNNNVSTVQRTTRSVGKGKIRQERSEDGREGEEEGNGKDEGKEDGGEEAGKEEGDEDKHEEGEESGEEEGSKGDVISLCKSTESTHTYFP